MVLFNINNLISPTIKELLSNANSSEEKVNILFQLIDYNYNFSPEVINEIKSYYQEQSGEIYKPVYLDIDSKDLIIEYAQYFDFNKVLKFINAITFDDTKEIAISNAISDIAEERKKIERKKFEEKNNIVDNLIFYDEKKSENKNKEQKSLDTRFKEAQDIIFSKLNK